MLSIRKMLFKNRKGFTLIELIVVIAILAILAVLAIPRFLGTLENARYTTHNANVKTLKSAGVLAVAELGSAAAGTWNASNDYVDTWPTMPTASGLSGDYEVVITAEGDVTVTPGLATDTGSGWTVASEE